MLSFNDIEIKIAIIVVNPIVKIIIFMVVHFSVVVVVTKLKVEVDYSEL